MQPHRMTGAGVNVQLAFVIITGTMCPWAAARVHVRAIKQEIKWDGRVVGSQCAVMFRGGRERERRRDEGVQVRLSRHVEPGQLCPLLLQLLQGCPLVNGSAASSDRNRAGWRTGRCVADLDWLASRGTA